MTDSHGPRVPRASAQVMRDAFHVHRKQRRSHALRRTILGVVTLVALVWGANTLFVARPVAAALRADTALARVEIRARFRWYLDPTTLILDLERYDAVEPKAALSGLVQAIGALREAGRDFRLVLLTHGRDAAFALGGDDFERLAKQAGAGANPTVLGVSVPGLLRDVRDPVALRPWSGRLPALLGLRGTDAPRVAALWASGGR